MAVDFVSSLLTNLPQLLQAMQIASLLILAFFYGSLIISSFRSPFRGLVRYVLAFAFGILALVGGSVLEVQFGSLLRSLPIPSLLSSIASTFVFGIISAAIISVSLWLLTAHFPKLDRLSVLEAEITRLRHALLAHRVIKPIDAGHARAVAEKAVPGFSVSKVDRGDDRYAVTMKKDRKSRIVVVGAFSGDVIETHRSESRVLDYFSDPVHLIGAVVLAGFLLFAAASFRGFSDPASGFMEELGLPGFEDLPGDCVSLPILLSSPQVAALNYDISKLPAWDSVADRVAIEQGTGAAPTFVKQLPYSGVTHAVAVVESAGGSVEICSATAGVFCQCVGSENLK